MGEGRGGGKEREVNTWNMTPLKLQKNTLFPLMDTAFAVGGGLLLAPPSSLCRFLSNIKKLIIL